METKANHLLIGSFVLVLLAGIFGFMIWLSRGDVTQTTTQFRIFFTDSVAGLSVGGDVRFHGVRVGSIKQISIDRDNPARVKVLIDIDANTPVRADSYATLQLQGITGVSFVQISGGTPDSPLLPPNKHGEPPELPSRPSQISQLVDGAPHLLSEAVEVLQRANGMFSEDNRRNVALMLDNGAELSARVASHGAELEQTLSRMSQGADEMAAAAKKLNAMSDKLDHLAGQGQQAMTQVQNTLKDLDTLVKTDGRGLLQDSRKTVQSYDKAAGQLNAMLAENRPAIAGFTAGGLNQLDHLLGETRQLVAAMARLTDRLNSDPTRLFYGDQAPERRAP